MKNINKNSKVKPCKAHFEWTRQVVAIGKKYGDEAAQKWMEENPYQDQAE